MSLGYPPVDYFWTPRRIHELIQAGYSPSTCQSQGMSMSDWERYEYEYTYRGYDAGRGCDMSYTTYRGTMTDGALTMSSLQKSIDSTKSYYPRVGDVRHPGDMVYYDMTTDAYKSVPNPVLGPVLGKAIIPDSKDKAFWKKARKLYMYRQVQKLIKNNKEMK